MIRSTCPAILKNITVHPTLHSFRIFPKTIISSHIYRLFTCYSITTLQSFSILLNFSLFQFYLHFNIIHTKPSDGFPNRSWLHRKNNYCAKLILLKQSLLLRMKYVIFIWWFMYMITLLSECANEVFISLLLHCSGYVFLSIKLLFLMSFEIWGEHREY